MADVLLPPAPGAPLPPLDPVVLIPENPTVREVRRSRMRLVAWAAGFVVVVGAGFLGVTSYQQAPRNPDGRLRISPDEFTSAPPRAEREGAAADSAPTLSLTDSGAPPLPPAKAPAAETESKSLLAAPAPKPPAPDPRPAVAERAANAKAPALVKAAESPRSDNAPPAEPRREQPVSRTDAQATADLDRRRTRERAAEATAALDRDVAQQRAAAERERQLTAERAAAGVVPAAAGAAAPAPAPAPARPPVDERTGISSRIGLDEAARQLGGPLHAIDGMTRQMVGLVSGISVEGADPARPVVRAVYVDRSSGTMLFLDQQMARPGEGPATPQTGRGGRQIWVKDGVLLVLHGELGADSLRSLARRVR